MKMEDGFNEAESIAKVNRALDASPGLRDCDDCGNHSLECTCRCALCRGPLDGCKCLCPCGEMFSDCTNACERPLLCSTCGRPLDDGMCDNPDCGPSGLRDEKGRFRSRS